MSESLLLSRRFRLLILVAGFLFMVNLLIMNDYATIWSGSESVFIWNSLFEPTGMFLPFRVVAGVAAGQLNEFLLRLPGVVVVLLGLASFFMVGRKVFGREATMMTLLVVSASLLLPNLSKLATLDSWAFSAQLAAISCLVLFLKDPGWGSRLLFYLFLGMSVWFRPLSSVVLFAVFPTILLWAHPQGRRMLGVNPWLAVLAWGAVLWWSGQRLWEWPGLMFSFRTSSFFFLLGSLWGWLPFLGFLVAGLGETLVKVRKGEELSLINAAWLAASLVGHSLVLQMVFALLVSRQLRAYFDPRYPYRGIVRTISIVHLVLVFFGAMYLMIQGFLEFGQAGFFSGLAVGMGYWMLSLVSVIGLFGLNRRFIIGGAAFSGLLVTLLFWLQAFPLLESRRNLPQRLAAEAAKINPPGTNTLLISQPGYDLSQSNIALYGRAEFPRVIMLADRETEEVTAIPEEKGVLIFERTGIDRFPEKKEAVELEGWDDLMRPITFVVMNLGTLENKVEEQ